VIVVTPAAIPLIAFLTSIFIHLLAFASLWLGMYATTEQKQPWKPKIVMRAMMLDSYDIQTSERKKLNYTPKALEERSSMLEQLAMMKKQQQLNELRRQKLAEQKSSLNQLLDQSVADSNASNSETIENLTSLNRANAQIDSDIDKLAKELAEFEALYQDISNETAGGSEEQILVNSYQTYILNAISKNWSRPASARRGMQVLLKIDMLPNGTVVAINTVQSSGNKLFDRSAIAAVRKASPLTQMRNLSSLEFERNFRTFQLLFNPTDLRL